MLLLILGLVGCSSSTTPGGQPAGTDATSAADYSLTVDKIGIDHVGLSAVGLNPDRTLQVPPVEHPEQAALYTGGPQPGQPGPAVIVGHVNGSGRPGVFARLNELREGDHVTTTAADGTPTDFVVYRVQTIEKEDFSTHDAYSDTPGPELRLITCGGDLDRTAHSYVSNVVVYARKA